VSSGETRRGEGGTKEKGTLVTKRFKLGTVGPDLCGKGRGYIEVWTPQKKEKEQKSKFRDRHIEEKTKRREAR